jgi:hypothetical protein
LRKDTTFAMTFNPFIVKGYLSEEYFCDRQAETRELMENIRNHVDTTLHSPRKYGKTGLILHVLQKAENEGLTTLYVDVFSTLNLNDFIHQLSDAVLRTFPQKSSIGKRFLELLKGFRPLFSFDPLTGSPQVSFHFFSEKEKENTLKSLLGFLDSQSQNTVVAIDEFQQIAEYPEKNVEAILRAEMQNMKNTVFIFSGSRRRVLQQMFNDVNRPFYSSTQTIALEKIPEETYAGFIENLFTKGGCQIDKEAILFILEWTRRHTFYTQYLCNRIWGRQARHIDLDLVKRTANDILDLEESSFLQYRDLLTVQQWRLLIGLAKEGRVEQITSNAFVSKHRIGSATTSARAAETMVGKELILKTLTKEGSYYEVYNPFFSRWLEKVY